ncbi:ribosome biogenesis protein Nop16 [Syncephalis plumigaleata]|nr:ribosome biogenesis protein Nop16 [Syncephalis plumigaleata]
MGKRPHARRVNRQPTQKNTRRVAKRTARKRPIAQDKLVAAHWDKRLTVRQNYAQLGLAHRVNGVAGGTERSKLIEEMIVSSKEVDEMLVRQATQADPLLDGTLADPAELAYQPSNVIAGTRDLSGLDEATLKRRLGPGRAMIKRDSNGNITSVIMGTEAESGDEHDDNDEDDDLTIIPQVKAKSKLIQEMERKIAEHVPHQRHLSHGEIKWAKEVIAKHGDRYENAFRDLKLNKLQRTVGQIRTLCERYLATQQNTE